MTEGPMRRTIVLELSPEAVATIGDCCRHTARLAMHYGEGSPQHVRAARSLIAVLNSILHFGGQLRWDADLCLVGLTESGITYGVVFHADHDNQDHGADGPEPGTWSLHS